MKIWSLRRIGIILVLALAMVTIAPARPRADDSARTPAPDFTAKVWLNSQPLRLSRLRGKVVLVDFWGTFCEPCKQSFPKLQDLHTKYGSSGLRIVGISEDDADSKGEIPGFASALGAKFTLGWDEDKSIARSYKPPTMPSSFLIDKKGVVRYVHAGYHDGDELHVDKEIKELLAE
jgi:cytochrome c biogenesis protein CcmG/thiol:disulfide interchange protein DsbE